ncbi:hypothetical protein L2719_00910 [Shewanella schlegeliana]|uniref:Uncharacterized protein n=1 Tax=Shewanella schlegeliana TaxID=190308 RepID=A0ABS1SV57_9GAMM|nr:hypothetical protein [Shewanella schlegeliana]MBL4912408.1 hypothetical protein [Shewanella schlegeliana]MCL1108122.1 hypothetical protein [Shewanella schlegeliana]GIU21879.1 hypothetical protein TUM4433_01810 [Shewanella schlegeliana]
MFNAIKTKFHPSHQTHKETLIKFIVLLAIIVVYFGYMSWKYNASTGFALAVLSWSFFVLCTPVADGGFLIAFPVRLLFNVRMAITQVVLWFIAVGVNVYFINFSESTYQLTFLTRLLQHILTQPIPYWSILAISALGTLLSIYFGDEMMDVVTHKDRVKHHQHGFKYRILLVVGMGAVTITAYYHLLRSLGVHIPG